MSKKGKKKSRSEKVLNKVILATATIELLIKIVELVKNIFE